MRQHKLVTVIIPTFRRSSMLQKTLTSVLLQDFEDYDVIVVDDNIEEKESNQVKDICLKNDVNYIKNYRKKGGCGARNSGILSTSSIYVAFLDDDDLWLDNKLREQVWFLNFYEKYSAVYTSFYNYNLDINVLTTIDKGKDLTHRDLLEGNCPTSSSLVLANRELLVDAGLFDENLPSFQDYDMWLRLTLIKPMGFINKKLAIFTQHSGDRVSVNIEKRFQGLDMIINKWGEEIKRCINISTFEKNFKSAAYASNAISVTGHSYKKMITYRVLSLMNNKTSFACWKSLFFSLFGSYFFYIIFKLKSLFDFQKKTHVLNYIKKINEII